MACSKRTYKPLIPVEASKKFLYSYVDSLLLIKQGPEVDILKGKQPALLSNNGAQHKLEPSVQPSWIPPPCGVAKLNFDGSFVQADGTASAGMVLRDHTDAVIYAACRWIRNCSGALEAELSACEEGLKLALHWTPLPIQVEKDYVEILKLLELDSKERSRNMFQVAAVSKMLQKRSTQVTKIGRSNNKVAHAMAAMGRGQQCTAYW